MQKAAPAGTAFLYSSPCHWRDSKETITVLSDDLRALEDDGLIEREVFAEVPPRVVYSLSPLGKTLKPILDAMFDWGTEYKNYLL